MSILSKYYDLLTQVTIANGEVKDIDPDKPYTIVYYSDSRMLSQSTGIIRGVIGEPEVIVIISLDAEDVNFATIIRTTTIVAIDPYSFDAHFDNFNNWIGVEVSEHNCIQMRVKFVNAESIVMVEEGKTYEVGYIQSINGQKNYVTGTGRVRTIVRNTTKEAMPTHSNHFTNDIDYIIGFDFGTEHDSAIVPINAIDIRVIRPYVNPIRYDIGLLNELQTEVNLQQSYNIDKREYTHASYDIYRDALLEALRVLNMQQSTITDSLLQTTLDNLRNASKSLQDISDEYDLVDYDKDNNIVYCNESIYPVAFTGIGDNCIKLEYYTNFGTPRVKHINSDSLEVMWSGINPRPTDKPAPVEEKIESIREEFYKNHEDSPQGYNLYVYHCSLAALDLGIRVRVTKEPDHEWYEGVYGNRLPLSSPKVLIKDSTIRDLDISGTSVECISYNAKVDISYCDIVDMVIGGSKAALYNASPLCDRFPTNNASYVEITTHSSTFENVWCGGLQTNTIGVTLQFNGDSEVKTLYACGIHGSYTDKVNIVALPDSDNHIPKIEEIIVCNNDNTVQDVCIESAAKTTSIVPGGYEAEDGGVIQPLSTKPSVRIDLLGAAEVTEILKMYSGGKECGEDLICIKYPKVITDENLSTDNG